MTGVAIATGVAAIAGIAASAISANNAAKAQRNANEQNAALMREQMAYQTSERIAAQDYNTPANQRQRFESAGINPYLALGNINAGNTEAMTGVDTPTMQAATDNTLANLVGGLGEAPLKVSSMVQNVQQIQANKEAVEQARTQTVFQSREKIMALNKQQAEINESLSRLNKNSQEYENLKQIWQQNEQMIKRQEIELKYYEDYYSSQNRKEKELANLAHEQSVGQWIKNRIESIHSQYAARIDAATLKRINAAAANEWSQVESNKKLSSLYDEKSRTEFEMRVVNKAGVKLDNEKKNIVNHYLGDMMETSLESQRLSNSQKRQDYSNPFKYVGGAVLGMLGGAIGGVAGGAAGAAAGSAAGAGAGYSVPNTSYGTPANGWSQLGY